MAFDCISDLRSGAKWNLQFLMYKKFILGFICAFFKQDDALFA